MGTTWSFTNRRRARHVVTELVPQPKELLRFTFPRQREGRRLCISDFFAPKASGKMDVLGLSLVTIGSKASAEAQHLFEGGEYITLLYLRWLDVHTAPPYDEVENQLMRVV